jgi:hypothetical protein
VKEDKLEEIEEKEEIEKHEEELLKEVDVHRVDDVNIINEKGEFENCHHEVFYPENFIRKGKLYSINFFTEKKK